ncbi:hypothetical protein MA9V2_215 [Chryseobacterium phage MA9V-2]|nr:hypothetical protein MA9V2_215 [Chryseobacterium phage MA9V-2]
MQNKPILTRDQKLAILGDNPHNWDVDNLEIVQDIAITNEFVMQANEANYKTLLGLGWTNHYTIHLLDKINLNYYIDTPEVSGKPSSDFKISMRNHFDQDVAEDLGTVPNSEVGTAFTNLWTRQNALVTHLFKASSIMNTMYGNFGKTIIVNSQLAAAIKSTELFKPTPVEELAETSSTSMPYVAGTITTEDGKMSLKVVVNPQQPWADTTAVLYDGDFDFQTIELEEGLTSISFAFNNGLGPWA